MSPFSSKIHRRREVTEKLRGQILSYFDKTSRLNDRIRVEAVIFDNTKKKADVHGLWKVDAPYYLAIYSDQEEGCERNAGYLMEQMVLYMTAKGLGTCYLGSVQPAQKVRGGKRCLMMVAFGYPEGKLYRESPLAKRLPLNELCIFKEEAGEQMKTILRAARLAPSAMNTQPALHRLFRPNLCVRPKNPLSGQKLPCDARIQHRHYALPYYAQAAEELWMELQTETEEHFAAKSYKMEIMCDVDAALDALIHCVKC